MIRAYIQTALFRLRKFYEPITTQMACHSHNVVIRDIVLQVVICDIDGSMSIITIFYLC